MSLLMMQPNAVLNANQYRRYYPNTKLFVYGSLMRGMSAHHLIEKYKYLGIDSIRYFVMMKDGLFPSIFRDHRGPDETVHGEVYEIPNPVEDFKALDHYEGVNNNLYYRAGIQLSLHGWCECYMRVAPWRAGDSYEKVMDGKWLGPDTPTKLIIIPPTVPYNPPPYNNDFRGTNPLVPVTPPEPEGVEAQVACFIQPQEVPSLMEVPLVKPTTITVTELQ